MKKLWLIVTLAVSILPGCLVATDSPHRLDCQFYHEDCGNFLDDFDGLFDLFDGYYGNNNGNGHEEDPLLDSIFPGIGQEMDELD